MYVLGDSILDVGNNNYLPGAGAPRPNRPYYGIDFPGRIPTGRFSNGFNTADYIGAYVYTCSVGVFANKAYISICMYWKSSLILLYWLILQQRRWGWCLALRLFCCWHQTASAFCWPLSPLVSTMLPEVLASSIPL
jgi:hypothetical protein